MEFPRAHQTAVPQVPGTFKWKTTLALVLLLISIVFNWAWAFGILFIAWAVCDMMAGRVYFVEEIDKVGNPILFWVIAILWLLTGLYYLLAPFLPPAFI